MRTLEFAPPPHNTLICRNFFCRPSNDLRGCQAAGGGAPESALPGDENHLADVVPVGMWSKGGKGWVSLWSAPVGSGATGRAVQGRQRRPAGLSTPERSEPPGARSASSTYPRAARSAEIKEGGSGETNATVLRCPKGRLLAMLALWAARGSGAGLRPPLAHPARRAVLKVSGRGAPRFAFAPRPPGRVEQGTMVQEKGG